MYLCWQKDGKVLGVASSKERAQEMCNEIGDSYLKIELNTPVRKNIEVTKMCVHHTKYGFLTYEESIKKVKEILNLN